jgi:hypothetical protein
MPLSPAQINILRSASRPSVEQEFNGLQARWANGIWVRNDNRYRVRCRERLRGDVKHKKVKSPDLREYIAASTVLHCMDGWAYFGRALVSYLFGDADVARHLAYYAELRATMALLATEGIGVFDKVHFAIDQVPRCRVLRASATHEFVWEALKEWGETAPARSLLFSIPVAGGQPVQAWLNHFTAPGGILGLLAREWLEHWGLDLERLADDRESRNIVSYRPTAFTSPRSSPTPDATGFVRHVWELCEPTLSMRFRRLDQYLLRVALEYVFRSVHGRTRLQASQIYAHRVSMMLHQLGPGDMTDDEWRAFLTFQAEPNHPKVLVEARKQDTPDQPGHAQQVLARAVLLLRIATGACANLISTVAGFPNAVQFWWGPLGEDRSVWANGGAPAQAIDLWADVDQGLVALETWEGLPATSYWGLWQQESISAAILGTCERIGFWGLGL